MCRKRLNHCLLLIVLAGLVGLGRPAPLWATTARMASLAGGDFLEDDHNVQRWYGSLGDYPGQIVLEGGHFTLPHGWHDNAGRLVSGPGVGLHLALDEAGQWGTAALFANSFSDDVDPGSLARDGLGTTWSAMWSRRFGSLQPTLMYRRGTDSDQAAIMPGAPSGLYRSWDRTRTELGGGLRWDLTEGLYLDLAGEVRHHGEQTSVADSVMSVPGAENTSQGSFGLRARTFVRLSPVLALVPTLEWLHDDRALPSASPRVSENIQGDLVKLGSGLNWYPDPDHFLVVGLDYIHADPEVLTTDTTSLSTVKTRRAWDSVAFTLGFESRFRYWLTFRGSVRYEAVDFSSDTTEPEEDFATFMVNLGAAAQLGNYDLDLAVTDQEPRSVTGYYGHSLFGNPATWLTISLRRTFALH